jgi:hypothetical protein
MNKKSEDVCHILVDSDELDRICTHVGDSFRQPPIPPPTHSSSSAMSMSMSIHDKSTQVNVSYDIHGT